jgi:predicted amidohydrolase
MLNVVFTTVPMAERRDSLLNMLDEAGKSGCQIVLFPEFADHHRVQESLEAHKTKDPKEVRRVCGLRLDSPWMREVAARAKKYKMVVIPEVMLQDGKHWYNSAVVFGPRGEVLGQYRKTHLPCGEEEFFGAGDEIKPIATPFGKLGLMICYDRNFPEIARCHEIQGAEILLWTTMRQGELENGLYGYVLPATAITHGMPFAVATYVTDDQVVKREVMTSVIYDAFGQVVSGGLMTNGIVRGTVDLDERPLERRAWKQNPEWVCSASYLRRRRRPELYGALAKPLSKEQANPASEPTALKPKP